MKRIFSIALISSSFLLGTNSVKADWNSWAADTYRIFTVNTQTESVTKEMEMCDTSLCGQTISSFEYTTHPDKVIFKTNTNDYWEYDKQTNLIKNVSPWYEELKVSDDP